MDGKKGAGLRVETGSRSFCLALPYPIPTAYLTSLLCGKVNCTELRASLVYVTR